MPKVYDKEAVARKVVDGLSVGTPLTVICSDHGMPCDDTVRAWAAENEELSRAIARAREAGHDTIAHRMRQTARGSGDSTGDVQRDKLIIETDLKLLAKWDPKRYGDATMLKHADADGGKLDLATALSAARERAARSRDDD